MPPGGRLVILNGASSSGKTTLATAFRDRRAASGDFWLHIAIDDYLSKLPLPWLDLGLVVLPVPAPRPTTVSASTQPTGVAS